MKDAYSIERLNLPATDSEIRSLAELLVDAIESGAAVSFLAPLTLEAAEAWWRDILSGSDPRAIFLIARDAEGIAGTVQLHPAWAPNQPHRAEIVKLLVHRRSRRAGLGTELMRAIEDGAREAGFRLLTLDAKRGEAAEHLYRHLGWIPAGTIPRYALDTDGTTPHDAVIFYKELGRRLSRMAKLLSLGVVVVSLLASVPAGAQQAVAPPPPQIPYGTPITLEQAKTVMAGAEAEARENGWNVVIAILDSGANLVMLQRLDSAQLGSVEVAQDKARSAVLFRRPTKAFQELIAQGGAQLRLLRLSGAIPLEGGIPIIVDGKIIGAIGVSGVASEQDARIATAGLEALTK